MHHIFSEQFFPAVNMWVAAGVFYNLNTRGRGTAGNVVSCVLIQRLRLLLDHRNVFGIFVLPFHEPSPLWSLSQNYTYFMCGAMCEEPRGRLRCVEY